MKKLLFVTLLLLGGCLAAFSQDGVKYTDASAFPVYGKAYTDDGPRYRRLPESLNGVVRDALWNLGTNSAGLYIRFRTNAPEIHAKWTNTGFHMPHMTDAGVGGLDLYAFLDGKWEFVGTGFDWKGARNTDHTRRLVGHMDAVDREYMLYLSLYDEVKTLELGVPEGYTLEQPVLDSPRSDAPVVMYGTSILQGGCASRAGMAHTNILARRFDRTVINLGFSGNAHLDLEIAELMASVENPSVYVLDYVPNASPEKIETLGEKFFRIIRDKHPDVPVIFVEDPLFPHGIVDHAIADEVSGKNAAQKALFQRLQDAGVQNIYYIPALGMTTSEDFVDGVHLTDLGMTHYADHITPLLQNLLK
jgi:hypothetical protein